MILQNIDGTYHWQCLHCGEEHTYCCPQPTPQAAQKAYESHLLLDCTGGMNI